MLASSLSIIIVLSLFLPCLKDHLKKELFVFKEILSKVRLEEQDGTKKFFQRLFPDIDIPDNLSYDQWAVHVEEAIQRFVADLEKTKEQGNQTEVTKLQAKVKMYKEIISKTVSIAKDNLFFGISYTTEIKNQTRKGISFINTVKTVYEDIV